VTSEPSATSQSCDQRRTIRGQLSRWSRGSAMARVLRVVTWVLGGVLLTTQGVSAASALRAFGPVDHRIVTLGTRGVGPVHFGTPKIRAVRSLQKLLGSPNAQGINTGCGPNYTEVTWEDFIAEFRLGRFSGYRYIIGGYPVQTKGSPRDHVSAPKPVPLMATAAGITLGNDLAELRQRYRKLRQSGAASWTASSGLTFVIGSKYRNMYAGTDKIVEIKIGTCGAF
jgi:hypothetical protein